MQPKYKKSVQFYAVDQYGTRRIFSFRVENVNDALNGLKRMNQERGWFVVRDQRGQVLRNEPIEARKIISQSPARSFLETIFSLYK